MSESLTTIEGALLEAAERVISEGLTTFWNVGRALAQIRDERLYRKTHETFEDYCKEKWDMTSQYARRLANAADVFERIETTVSETPTTERQVRPLTQLPPEQQPVAWKEAVESAPNGKPTAKHVQAAVERVKAESEPGNPLAGITVVDANGTPMPAEKKEKLPAYIPSDGLQYAEMAIIQLEKIQPQDTQRTPALTRVRAWIEVNS